MVWTVFTLGHLGRALVDSAHRCLARPFWNRFQLSRNLSSAVLSHSLRVFAPPFYRALPSLAFAFFGFFPRRRVANASRMCQPLAFDARPSNNPTRRDVPSLARYAAREDSGPILACRTSRLSRHAPSWDALQSPLIVGGDTCGAGAPFDVARRDVPVLARLAHIELFARCFRRGKWHEDHALNYILHARVSQ
jgi:hypothetical protein